MTAKAALFLASSLAFVAGCSTPPVASPMPPAGPPAFTTKARFTMAYLEPSQVDDQPVAIHRVGPRYPKSLRRAGIAGYAIVYFVIDTDGIPREVQCVEASNDAFGEAGVAAVQQWRFRPALKNGVPVACEGAQRIEFNVADD